MNCNNIAYNDICDKNTQQRFEWAVTYLASGENGKGLDPRKFEVAMEWAKEWKVNLVKFLVGKPIKGSKTNEIHTRDTAVACADAVFTYRYEQEVRAFASEPIQPYWTRNELSGIEFGELEVDKIGRLAAEQEPIFVLPRAWTSKKQMKLNMGYFLSHLAKGKTRPSIILRNARAMARNYAISWEDYKHLVEVAGGIHVEAMKSQAESVELPL